MTPGGTCSVAVRQFSRYLRESAYYLVLLALIYLLFSLTLPKSGFGFDIKSWDAWARGIHVLGLGHAYRMGDLNYPPLYLYILALFGSIQGSAEAITANINYLKLFTLLFDFIGIYAAMRFFRQSEINPINAFFILFNIAYLYNTVIWGQVDAIHTTFIFLAFLLAIKEKTTLSVLLFVLALNTKLQSIIFLLPLVLILLPALLKRKIRIVYALAGALLLELAILAPFILSGDLERVWNVTANLVDFFPFVSMNAYNIWHLLVSGVLREMPDSIVVAGLSYKQWGMLLFVVFSAIVLLPVLVRVLYTYIEQATYSRRDYRMFALAFLLLATVFFYFNTQMHERYIHPAIIFGGVYAFLSGDYAIYILVSLGYVLNLEKVMRYLELSSYDTPWFSEQLIALLFLVCLILGIYDLYLRNNLFAEARQLIGAWRGAGQPSRRKVSSR